MCRFAVIHSEMNADKNRAVHRPEWLEKMRPETGYKELFNEKTLARNELFPVTLSNLKRQGFHPPSDLALNTRISIKVLHIIYGGDTRAGERTAAGKHIKDINTEVLKN